jgi:hypothetical protein
MTRRHATQPDLMRWKWPFALGLWGFSAILAAGTGTAVMFYAAIAALVVIPAMALRHKQARSTALSGLARVMARVANEIDR